MKKLFPVFFILIFFSFNTISQENPITQDVTPNLLTSTSFPKNTIKNLSIETTYESLEILESYGTELTLELYGNNNKLLPKIITTKNSLSISSTTRKTTPGDFCKIVLYIPADTIFSNLSVITGRKNKSTINLANLKSDLFNIETYDSDICGNFITGNMIIKSVMGNVIIDNICSDNSAIFTEKGHISIKNAEISQFSAISNSGILNIKNLTGEYFLTKTQSGNISLDNAVYDYFDIKSLNGNISISLKQVPTGASTIESEKGFVQCFIPSTESFSLMVHSTKGTFFNKLDNSRNTPRHQFEKDYNNGGAELSIKTFSGDIEVDEY